MVGDAGDNIGGDLGIGETHAGLTPGAYSERRFDDHPELYRFQEVWNRPPKRWDSRLIRHRGYARRAARTCCMSSS